MPRVSRSKASIRIEPVADFRLNDYVHAVAFSATGEQVAACTASGHVAAWDVRMILPASEMHGHEGAALAVSWDATTGLLASGGHDGAVRVWETTSGEERAILSVGPGDAWAEHVAWSHDTGCLAASAGKVLRIWNYRSGGMFHGVAEFTDHPSTISAVCWAPHERGILSASYGGVRLWCVGQSEPVRLFPYQGAVVSLALNPEGSFLAIGSLDASVHLFRTDTDQNWHMSGYPSKVRAVAFDAEGLHLYTVAAESLVVWNMNKFEGTSGRLFKGHVGWIQQMACHPVGRVVATVGEDGLLCLWEPSTRKPMLTRQVSDTGALSCVAWSPDGQWLATGAHDGRVTIFITEGLRI